MVRRTSSRTSGRVSSGTAYSISEKRTRRGETKTLWASSTYRRVDTVLAAKALSFRVSFGTALAASHIASRPALLMTSSAMKSPARPSRPGSWADSMPSMPGSRVFSLTNATSVPGNQ